MIDHLIYFCLIHNLFYCYRLGKPKKSLSVKLQRIFEVCQFERRSFYNYIYSRIFGRNLPKFISRCQRYRPRTDRKKGILGINIGPNKETKNQKNDFCLGLSNFCDLADYITVNISSPNTPGLRELQNRGRIEKLVQTLQKKQEEMNSLENTPIFFKIAPDIDEEQIRDIALISLANNIDGLVISNSTIERSDTLKSNLNNEIGGLSGKPLFLKSTMILRKMYTLTNGQIPLIGVGGINNALECYEKIKSGASLVQLYSALTFEGPKIINKILIDLSNLLKTDGYKSIKEAIGKDT